MRTGIANADLTGKQGYAVKIVAEDTLKGGNKYDLVAVTNKVDGILDNGAKANDTVGVHTKSGSEVFAYVGGAVTVGAGLVAGATGSLVAYVFDETKEQPLFARALQASTAGGELIKVEII